MRLEELSPGLVSRALDAYLELAYGGSAAPRGRPDQELPPDAPTEQVLALFQRQDVPGGPDGKTNCRRYTMRLGNRNYPFMKLLVQEHIVPGVFYFSVDTHDDMDLDPSYPDYEQWQQLRKFNRELKRQIEARFEQLRIPTAALIKGICEQHERDGAAARATAAVASQPITDATVLVVDDEEELGAAVASLLRNWGYRTLRADDGPSGLDLARRELPDLVLLDYELPEMDGLEVLQALKADARTREVPVLLCTASRIGMADIGRADGFLAKPFQQDLLREMVGRLLRVGAGDRDGLPEARR